MEHIQVSFGQGEISPAWFGRADLPSYANACRKLDNFLVLPTGGITKRPGTKYMGSVKTASTATRLYAFRTSATASVVLEFGNLYVRFWNDSGLIESGGSPVEYVTPYATADLFGLRMVQVVDVLYIYHRDYAPRVITYTSDTSWAITTPALTTTNNIQDQSTADQRPGAATVYEQRLIVAGTNAQPGAIMGSKPALLTDFSLAATPIADDGFGENPLGYERVDILWLLSQNYLLIGSTDGLWRGGSPEQALDASQANGVLYLRRQSSVGTADLQAVGIADYAVFVERGRKRVRIARYEEAEQQFITPAISLAVHHYFESNPVNGLSYQLTPNSILWVCREDGGPAAFAYDQASGTAGWSSIDVGGVVESLTVAPGDGEDAVWAVVVRTIDGSTVRYVERFQDQSYSVEEDCFYVDSGVDENYGSAVTVTGVTTPSGSACVVTAVAHGFSDGYTVRFAGVVGTTGLNGKVYTVDNATTDTFELLNTDGDDFSAYVSGGEVIRVVNTVSLAHLEGEEVVVWADGAVQSSRTVSAGTITLDKYANRIICGLPYTARVDLLPIPASFGKAKRVYRTAIRFYRTIGAKAGASEDTLENINFLTSAFVMGEGPSFYSDMKDVEIQGQPTLDSTLVITSEQPTPMTILQVVQDVIVEEELS